MSKETKFTPGPWHVDDTVGDCVPELVYDASGLGVAGADRPDRPRKEQYANAHLIAAAPDLYSALEEAERHLGELAESWRIGAITENDGRGGARSNRNREVLEAVRAALAKAKGDGK